MPGDFETALELQKVGNLDAAAALFAKVLDADPANAIAWHALGVLHNQRGEYSRAREVIGRAVALRPSVPAFHVNLGEALRNLGETKRAIGCCRTAIHLWPEFSEAFATLGLILHGAGRNEEAAEEFRRALALRDDLASAHNNFGMVLQDLGRLDEAVGHFRRAVELDPQMGRARTNLGLALLNQGKAADALPHFQEAARQTPDWAVLHHNVGNALRMLERPVEARAAYLEALQLDPDLAVSHLHVGMTLRREGVFGEALPWMKQAVALEPENWSFWEQLAELHGDREDPPEAVACWRRVVELSPGERPGAYLGLGWALQENGQAGEAKECYLTALRLQPDLAMAQVNLGSLYEEQGKLAEAESAFRAAIRMQPQFPLAHARLATLLRAKLPDADLGALERRVADPALAPTPRARLLFALAHVADARGDHARAGECLNQGNAISLEQARGNRDYDQDEHERFVKTLIETFDARFYERVQGMGVPSRRPVFIFGLPRSGTTLVEQVLASHPRVFGAGELRLGRQSFDNVPIVLNGTGPAIEWVGKLDAAAVRKLAEMHLERLDALNPGGLDRVIDKMPDNYLYLGLLTVLFPNAAFIHCRRDLRDIAVSCWMTDFRSIRWANSTTHLASRFLAYQRMMAHWQSVIPDRFQTFDYEETVADLESVARRLLSACGLEWDPACLEFHRTARSVRTASITQVRQPIYKRSVARWKNYEPSLGELFQALSREP